MSATAGEGEGYEPEGFIHEAGNPIVPADIVQAQLASVSDDIARALEGISDDVSNQHLMTIIQNVKSQLKNSADRDKAAAIEVRIQNMMSENQEAKEVSRQAGVTSLAEASDANRGMFQELSPEQQIAYLLRARQLLEDEFVKRPQYPTADDIRIRIGLSRLLNEQIYSIFTNMARKTRLVLTEHMYPLLVCAAVLLGGDGTSRYAIIATLIFNILATEFGKPGENFNDPVRPLILRIKDQLLTCGERGVELAGDATLAIGQLLANIETIRVALETERNELVTRSFMAIVDVGSVIKDTLNTLVDCWQIAAEFSASQASQGSSQESSQGSMVSNASIASNASTDSNASNIARLVGQRNAINSQLKTDGLPEVMVVVDNLLTVLAPSERDAALTAAFITRQSNREEEEEEYSRRGSNTGGRRSRRHKKRRSTLKRRRMKRRRTRKGKKRRHTKRR